MEILASIIGAMIGVLIAHNAHKRMDYLGNARAHKKKLILALEILKDTNKYIQEKNFQIDDIDDVNAIVAAVYIVKVLSE